MTIPVLTALHKFWSQGMQVVLADHTGDLLDVRNTSRGAQLHVIADSHSEAVASGSEPYHHVFRITGYQPAVPASTALTAVDLWTSPTASTYVFPTAGIQMKILGGNAQDAGSVGYSGTATGGTTTTLIDTGKNFTTLPVVAGDVILVQAGNVLSWGIVTTVAATTLTCSGGFEDGIIPTGYTYQVLDRSAGGTGIHAVMLRYLTTAFAQKETAIVLNGVAAVSTTPIDIYRVNEMHSLLTGNTSTSSGSAASVILADQATGLIVYQTIPPGMGASQDAIWTVPAVDHDGREMTAAYITGWQGSSVKGTSSPVGQMRLRATADDDAVLPNGTWLLKDQIILMNATVPVDFDPPIRVPSGADIKITCISDTAGTVMAGHIEGWYE